MAIDEVAKDKMVRHEVPIDWLWLVLINVITRNEIARTEIPRTKSCLRNSVETVSIHVDRYI